MPKSISKADTSSHTRDDTELKRPPMYKVLLHNDHYTEMDFVIEILMTIFNKKRADAVRTMLRIHHTGTGLCGIYPHEIAETKVSTVHKMANKYGFPLKCSIEPE